MTSRRSMVLRRVAQAGLALAALICLALTVLPAQERRASSTSRDPSPKRAAAKPGDSPASSEAAALKPGAAKTAKSAPSSSRTPAASDGHASTPLDYWSMLFVFALSTLIGLGVIGRVSRLLHTPLMSLTNAISAIAVVGAIIVAGSDYPPAIRFLGAVALFASMTNIVSGFLITDRMLKMFKSPTRKAQP